MKKIITGIILLGTIGLAINTLFGWNTFSWLTTYRINNNNLYMMKLDIWGYIENLKNSFSTYTSLTIDVPSRVWDTSATWGSLFNNLLVMLDWFLFAINIILYNFRVGGYFLLNLLALLGINTSNGGGLHWLIVVCETLRDLQISYI